MDSMKDDMAVRSLKMKFSFPMVKTPTAAIRHFTTSSLLL
jgi:hypothetical protein